MHNYTIKQDRKYITFKCKYCTWEYKIPTKDAQNIGNYFTLANHVKDNHYEHKQTQ